MATRAWVGAREQAWSYLLMLWLLGAAAGIGMGYLELLGEQLQHPPTFAAFARGFEAKVALGGALVATAFLKAAFIFGSRRFDRPLSLFSLIVFPVLNALFEGFVLLLAFDLGRFATSQHIAKPTAGTSALATHGVDGELFFKEFVLGFGPFLMAYTILYAFVWEEHVLPIHQDLDRPNVFMKAQSMQQFFLVALYYLTGDVATFIALRWVSDLLTVVAVRLPPPGVTSAELPDETGEGDVQEPDTAAAGGSGGRKRESKKKR